MPAAKVGEIVAIVSPEQLKAFNDILDLYRDDSLDEVEFYDTVFRILDDLVKGA